VGETASILESRSFDVDVERQPGVVILTAVGDIDLHSAPILRDELASVADTGPRKVVLDLSGATFLDSMALGVILAAKKRLVGDRGQLELVVSTPEIRRIFEITMLDRIFDLHETRAQAAGAPADAAG
jgi:anti-sigma B factor antagonist